MNHAPTPPVVSATGLTLGYGGRTIIRQLDLDIHAGDFKVIVGPNGCGKSTLLKAFARVNKPAAGSISLDGAPVAGLNGRAVARRISLLPQGAVAPEGITVGDLVARGRHPHHTLLRQWSPADDAAIAAALERTGLSGQERVQVSSMSGGQRQRAWLAMVLAQDTDVILLDEPTTFLDIAHQYDLLELFAELNREGRTIVAVLHDLNQAARFASDLVVMKSGAIHAQGPPRVILTPELVRGVFGLEADVMDDPQSLTPMVVPHVRV
ncbi:ABC transporter ATP-binding protein [Arthrobacter sp.]|uniref:ABC transporter ATP-binding protein n=1 Tax=Arthrobacter sp. TaxID=1667 RepID=UPI003A938D60